MTRLLAAAALAGAALVVALAWSIRPELADAAPPAARAEPASDIWAAAAEGCVRAGGTWWMGSEAGVVVARCRPFLGVDVVPAAKAVRR